MKTALLKLVAPLLAALCLSLAYTGTTFAAPDNNQGTAQQTDEKPDCNKNPDDARCRR
jgi:hypothetical protein